MADGGGCGLCFRFWRTRVRCRQGLKRGMRVRLMPNISLLVTLAELVWFYVRVAQPPPQLSPTSSQLFSKQIFIMAIVSPHLSTIGVVGSKPSRRVCYHFRRSAQGCRLTNKMEGVPRPADPYR